MPTSTPKPDWTQGYPMTYASVGRARADARRQLDAWRWGGDVDDAVLVVSELVSNAVSHTKVVGHDLWVRLAVVDGGALVVDVSDPLRGFPGWAPQPAAPSGDDERGRGLAVVRGLGAELSCRPRAHVGKTVRARLARGGL